MYQSVYRGIQGSEKEGNTNLKGNSQWKEPTKKKIQQPQQYKAKEKQNQDN